MNKVIKNIPIYSIGNILPQITSFILLPIYTRYMSPDQYGIVTSMLLIQSIFVIIFTLCLDRSIYRLYWDYNEDQMVDFLSTISIALVALGTLFLILSFIFQNYVTLIFTKIDFHPYFTYALLGSYVGLFSLIPMGYFMIRQEAGKYVILSVLRLITTIGFILYFVIFSNEAAAGYLKGQLYGSAILVPVFLFILIKIVRWRFVFNHQMLKNGLMYSLPIIPGIVGAWVLDLSDRIFIERFFSLTDVGLYSMGYKLSAVVGIIMGSISMAYTPFFFETANTRSVKDSKNILGKFNYIYMLLAIITCFIILLFSYEFVYLLLDKEYQGALIFVPVIVTAYLFQQGGGLIGTYFKQSKKTKQEAIITLFVAGLNVFLNFLIVPKYGAMGAAYTTLISFATGFGISYLYSKKYCYFIPFKWGHLLIIVIIFAGISYFSLQFSSYIDLYLSLLLKGLIVLVGGFILYKVYNNKFREVIQY